MPDTEVSFVPHRAIKPPPHANILLRFGCLFVSVYLPGRFPHRQLVLLHLPGQSSTWASSTIVPAEFTDLRAKVPIMLWIYCRFQSGFLVFQQSSSFLHLVEAIPETDRKHKFLESPASGSMLLQPCVQPY